MELAPIEQSAPFAFCLCVTSDPQMVRKKMPPSKKIALIRRIQLTEFLASLPIFTSASSTSPIPAGPPLLLFAIASSSEDDDFASCLAVLLSALGDCIKDASEFLVKQAAEIVLTAAPSLAFNRSRTLLLVRAIFFLSQFIVMCCANFCLPSLLSSSLAVLCCFLGCFDLLRGFCELSSRLLQFDNYKVSRLSFPLLEAFIQQVRDFSFFYIFFCSFLFSSLLLLSFSFFCFLLFSLVLLCFALYTSSFLSSSL